jgi:hypothetical protein
LLKNKETGAIFKIIYAPNFKGLLVESRKNDVEVWGMLWGSEWRKWNQLSAL